MKKQLLITSLCLSLTGITNRLNSQVTLVEPAGSGSQNIGRVSTSNNKLYFIGREEGGIVTDVYLWSNDGVTSTKIKLMSQVSENINPSYFFECGGKNYFFYSDGVSASGYEPWVTDGTAAGTFMIKDINPGAGNSVFSNGGHSCHCYNNKSYFTASDGVNGSELWVSDGTAAGTTLVKDIKPGSNSSGVAGMINYKGLLYFTAQSNWADEMWYTDGTTLGTVNVPFPAGLTDIGAAYVMKDTSLYFGGENGSGNFGIWKSNGTTLGTIAMTGTLPVTPLNALGPIITNGTDVFFGYQYYSAGYAHRLYKTDGISISLVKDSVKFMAPTLLGNKIVFKGEKTNSGTMGEPWVTDGTTSGTFKLNPVLWSTGGTNRNISNEFNNKIYFNAQSSLWETDGTIAGTVLTATNTGNIWDFTVLNSTLFFNAQNSANSNRQELFKLGGSISGIGERNLFEGSIQVYPQPANGELNIVLSSEANEVFVTINDLLGRKVKSSTNLVDGKNTKVDVSDLQKGIYVLQIRSLKGEIATKKIVIGK